MADAIARETCGPGPFAPAPYAPQRRSPRSALRQFVGLMQTMLTEYRSTWIIHVIFGLTMPLGMLFFLKFFSHGHIDQGQAIFLIGGNMTTSIAYGPTMLLINKIGWGREQRTFDYWAALPLSKNALVLAIVFVALLLALPGVLGCYLLGSLLLQLPLSGGVPLLLLLPLAAVSLAGFGAFMGAYAKNGQMANNLANMFIAFITFLSPMMVPLAEMPRPLQWVARITPPTYAADAFRAVLAGHYGTDLGLDIAVLLAFSVGMLWLVNRKLDWRNA